LNQDILESELLVNSLNIQLQDDGHDHYVSWRNLRVDFMFINHLTPIRFVGRHVSLESRYFGSRIVGNNAN
jgi:hypothetical protein